MVVQFREDFLGEELSRIKELGEIGSLLQESSVGLSFGHTAAGVIVAHYLEKLPSLSRTKQIPTLLMALADLAAERTRRRLSHGPSRSTCHVTAQQRVGPICQYLDEHYKEEIEFSVLANKFHID